MTVSYVAFSASPNGASTSSYSGTYGANATAGRLCVINIHSQHPVVSVPDDWELFYTKERTGAQGTVYISVYSLKFSVNSSSIPYEIVLADTGILEVGLVFLSNSLGDAELIFRGYEETENTNPTITFSDVESNGSLFLGYGGSVFANSSSDWNFDGSSPGMTRLWGSGSGPRYSSCGRASSSPTGNYSFTVNAHNTGNLTRYGLLIEVKDGFGLPNLVEVNQSYLLTAISVESSALATSAYALALWGTSSDAEVDQTYALVPYQKIDRRVLTFLE